MEAKYPSEFPTDSVMTLASIVKSGQIAARKDEFALSVWNVQGFVQGQLLGPGALNVKAALPVIVDEQDAIETATLLLEAKTGPAIDWMVLLPILKWSLQKLITLIPG